MSKIIPQRMTAEIDGDFVVFLIGMRVNKWWLPHKWVPVSRAMFRMLKELENSASEDTGFLGVERAGSVFIQYWRSFDHLETYARAGDHEHWPAWARFNALLGKTRGMSGSGMKPISSKQDLTKTFIAACHRSGLAKPWRHTVD